MTEIPKAFQVLDEEFDDIEEAMDIAYALSKKLKKGIDIKSQHEGVTSRINAPLSFDKNKFPKYGERGE